MTLDPKKTKVFGDIVPTPEMLAFAFGEAKGQKQDDLTGNEREAAELLSATVTEGVRLIKDIIPNERINELGRIMWDLVGNNIVAPIHGLRPPSLGSEGASGAVGGNDLQWKSHGGLLP
jgi:hypothetical protein